MPEPIPLAPQISEGIKNTVTNDNFQKLADSLTTNVIKDETGTPRLIIGKLPDNTYGLVISKEGIDVLTVFS